MKLKFLLGFAVLAVSSTGFMSAAVISTGSTVVLLAGTIATDENSIPKELPSAAVDGLVGKFYSPTSLPTLQLTPTIGFGNGTIVTALTLFTGNDTPGRDPSSFILSGSNDGGTTWIQIVSSAITLPNSGLNSNGSGNEGRNNNSSTSAISTATNSATVTFANTTAYTTYKFQVVTSRGTNGTNGGDAQFAELQLIGDVIPEPTSAMLSALGGLAVLTLRRRSS